MTGRGSRNPVAVGLAEWIVRIASRLVPIGERSEWEREWRAELWYLHERLEAGDGPSLAERAAFVCRALGSVADAVQLRLGDAQLWRESAASVADGWRRHPGPVAVALLFLSVAIAADGLLITFAHVMVNAPDSPWSGLVSEVRVLLLGVAVGCGVALILAGAAAAASLLGAAHPSPGEQRACAVELTLVAAVTGWVGRWFAEYGLGVTIAPYPGSCAASIDLGARMTAACVASWFCGLSVLTGLRLRSRRARRLSG